jgi:hypothetical protein
VTANAFMFIEEGTTLADTAWVLTTNDSITVGGAAGTAMTFTQFAGAGVGISAISIATVNGLQGSSSGGNSPVITLSTTLAAGPEVTGLERLYRKQLLLVGRKFLELLVGNGGTGAVSFTSGGLLRGNNVGALSVASAADIVAIGATFVTNATNATNATNTVNVVLQTTLLLLRIFILGKCCFRKSAYQSFKC